jgi:hypothetical protein
MMTTKAKNNKRKPPTFHHLPQVRGAPMSHDAFSVSPAQQFPCSKQVEKRLGHQAENQKQVEGTKTQGGHRHPA